MKNILSVLFLLCNCLLVAAQKQSPTDNLPLDYSYCGYKLSTVAVPDLPVKVFVSHKDGDQSARIQRAIDYVSSLKPDKVTGLRGAVLLDKGVFELTKALRISQSGVVLRGSSKTETVLCKTGSDRGAVVYIEGRNDRQILDTLQLADDYTAVGSRSLNVKNGTLRAGDNVLVVRPSTKEWVASINCDVFGGNLGYWGWKPGEMDVLWDRTIDANTQLDAPLTVALDRKWGGAYILRYRWDGRISNVGVENLTITTPAQGACEDHAWDGVFIDNAQDCWVRMLTFTHLAGSAVNVQRGAQQITVQDCISREPASEIGGLRRRTFLTMGGKCLFIRCYSEEGINDFSAGYCAPGPNAFVQCDAVGSHGFSGGSSSWATGLLFDNVNIENGGISLKNLGLDKWGAGWNSANSSLYQCSASFIDCYKVADDANNYTIGCWAYCQGNGFWQSINDHVNPYSAFQTQLAARTGAEAAAALCRTLERDHNGSTSPSHEQAAEMAREALNPRLTMDQWIAAASLTASTDTKGVKDIDGISFKAQTAAQPATSTLTIANGKLLLGSGYNAGQFHRTPWWNGRTRYPYMAKADYAVTRFVPGMECRGATDRIDSILVNIRKQGVVVWNQNYGLWYDRRRDDHERIKRPDGDVWAPFFEQSIARSGKGAAWDGLSKYDLSKLNTWYFDRINQLADAAPDMLIINQNFFQHNIIEAGAHWVDSPWRSANNIQSEGAHGTHFLEPVPFTGDKRIFTADLFYDISDADRAAHYKQYIWNVLDAQADRPNIYQSVSEEYTGPQQFVEFWLDCIAEWQKARGKDARVVLNATKDVTDAVLAQQKYRDLVDIIEIEQWFYDSSLTAAKNKTYTAGGKGDATLYAPKGGLNLAPRQHMRLTRTGQPTFEDVYRGVSEMRQAYPEKPVLYYPKQYDRHPWAVVLAGGSCPIMTIADKRLADILAKMQPEYSTHPYNGIFRMSGDGYELIYNTTSSALPLAGAKPREAFIVNKADGTLSPLKDKTPSVAANAIVLIRK